MKAIDTNLIVRILTNDDPGQAARARSQVDREDVLVLTTVVLETAWVLKSAFKRSGAEAAQLLEAFAGLPTVVLEEPDRVARALKAAKAGMDMADALHLAGASDCEAFLSFDGRMVRAALENGFIAVHEP